MTNEAPLTAPLAPPTGNVVAFAPPSGAPPMASVRRMPKRVVEVTLPAPYDDFHATCWVNFPDAQITKAQSFVADVPDKDEIGLDDTERERRAAAYDAGMQHMATTMSEIVLTHDFVDYDGTSLPATDDPAFWTELPNELRIVLFAAIRAQVGVLTPPKRKR